MELDFEFKSYDHIRYEDGKRVSGPHGRARRLVKVEPNIRDTEGYTVTIFNVEGDHPAWADNVQMAPKQMRIVEKTSGKIVLRGFGRDDFGYSFSDYGLSILHKNGDIYKCIAHMHDKNADIEYREYTEQDIEEEKVMKAKKEEYADLMQRRKKLSAQIQNFTEGRIDLSLCEEIKEIGVLNIVKEYDLRKDSEWSHWMDILGTHHNGTVYRADMDLDDSKSYPEIAQIDVELVQTKEEYENGLPDD